MRSLFFKIFACFWLSHMIIVALVFALLTAVNTTRDDDFRPGRPPLVPGAMLARHARAAAVLMNSPGASPEERRAKARAYLDSLEERSGLRALLFDASGSEISGRTLDMRSPQEARELALRALRSGEAEFFGSREGATGAKRALAPGGEAYAVVIHAPRRLRSQGASGLEEPRLGAPSSKEAPGTNALERPLRRSVSGRSSGRRSSSGRLSNGRSTWQWMEGARLVSIFVAATIVAYGLTLYLTGPTLKLRRATHQLAEGDLSVRVAPQMGRRRDELADLGRDFDQMAERIESLMQNQRRLLGDISHELRSPLARLQIASELAGQSAGEEVRPYLERIEREAERLNLLIGQLLTVSRLEMAGPEARRETVELEVLLGEVAADADFEARPHGRGVQVVRSQECSLQASPDLLRSAVENVVRNAARYTNEGTTVEVSLEAQGEEAMIAVRDWGPGVPEEDLPLLFRPFYRVATARDRQSGGVGLGLSITERAVRLHGGSVRASNAPGGGLLVEITLPLSGS